MTKPSKSGSATFAYKERKLVDRFQRLKRLPTAFLLLSPRDEFGSLAPEQLLER